VSLARNFIVLGGAGAIGRIVVRDLFESHRANRILIADYNAEAARAYACEFHSRRVSAGVADATKPRELANLLRGHSVLINCTQHNFNLRVMRAALAAKVHYIDLGGLFHWTRRQLKLDRHFKRARLTAIIGMGCSPGITNVMARYAADRLARVKSIRIRVGSIDRNARPGDFWFPYSAQTIVEELTLRPWVFAKKSFHQVAPRSGWEHVRFPAPVGNQWLVRTRHSEVATLPLSFRAKGLRNCDFKVGFDRRFVRELMRRLRAGWTRKHLAKLPAPRAAPHDFEIARVIVSGGGTEITVDCLARAKPQWRASAGDMDTGCPSSIVAQMIAVGRICQHGVLPPEAAVPVETFLLELKKRGIRIRVKKGHRS
jgi:lysine 6-dehydrogenase